MAVITDKMLYREGDDTVRMVVYAPRTTGAVQLRILLNGSELAKVQVDLDENGLGLFELRDPVAGSYTVEQVAAKASFTVAAYKLAPLTGRLEQVRIEGGKGAETLHFTALLETYGAPLVGAVKVTLVDMGSNPPVHRTSLTLEADASGRLKGSVALSGAGPFALQVQSSARRDEDGHPAPARLAPGGARGGGALRVGHSAPWRGWCPSRARIERRGLWIGSGGESKGAPLQLVEEAGKARVRFRADIDAWRVVVVDVHRGSFQELSGGPTEAGTTLDLPMAGTWTLVLAGLSYLGQRWEGRAALVLPGKQVQVEAPRTAGPGEEVEVGAPGHSGGQRLRARQGSAAAGGGHAAVRDRRLPAPAARAWAEARQRWPGPADFG